MLTIKTIDQVPIFPIKLKNALNLKGVYTQTSDGYTHFTYDVFNNIQDASLQKDSGLILTKGNNIQSLYKSPKRVIDSFKLNDYAYLYFQDSNYYVTFKDKNINVSHVYTTDDFIYFKITNNSISLIHNDLYFTVSREYPYNITLEPKKNIDYYQQQSFAFTQEENRIILLSRVIDKKTNKETKRYVSYSPITKVLRATGLHLSDLRVSEYYMVLERRVDSFYTPDYIPQSYAVEYYNNFQDTNTTNTEIANKIPVNDINFLVHVPYKNSTDLTNKDKQQFFDIDAEIVALKNILTPSYTVAKKPKPPSFTGFNPASIFFDLDIDARYDSEQSNLIIDAKSIPSTIFKKGTFPTNEYRFSVEPQSYNFILPYNGGKNTRERFPAETKNRIIGIASNGVYLNNFCSTETLTGSNNRNIYNFDLVYTKLSGIDFAGGAPDKNNLYKYYTGEFLFNDTWEEFLGLNDYYNFSTEHYNGHSKIFGVALDGFPIYGPYGYKKPDDSLSRVTALRSSYRVLSSVPKYRPPLSSYPLGYFVQDYNYNPSYGDLDAYNGRYCVTPEYPNGTYAYFLTIDPATQRPVFPYILGQNFYGKTIYEGVSSIDPETGQPIVEPPLPIIDVTINVPLSNIFVAGRNSNGQLLNGGSSDVLVLTQTLTGGWTKISLGATHALLLSGTDLYAGGNNTYGQIATSPEREIIVSTPKQIPGKWRDIFTTHNCSFAVDFDGNLYGAGDNRDFQLGRADLPRNFINRWDISQQIQEDGTVFKKIVGGITHTLGIKSDNKLYVTGQNEEGQLGMGENTKIVRGWNILPGGSEWLDIAAGIKHSIGLAGDGKIYSTGLNDKGELGVEDVDTVYEWQECTVVPPITGTDPATGESLYSPWRKIEAGDTTSYALAETGDLFAVGSNDFGELGTTTINPVNRQWLQIPGKWDDIAAGKHHLLALSGGNLFVSGNCNLGQLGQGIKNASFFNLTQVPQSSGNIVLESNRIASWTIGGGNVRTNANVIDSPFGTKDAAIITVEQASNNYYIKPAVQGGELRVNETYTMSVFLKYYDIPFVKWELPSILRSEYGIKSGIFDLASKRVVTGNTSRIEFYKNDWIRCITTFRTPAPPIRRELYLQAAAAGQIGIYGFQIEHGPFATPYQPTSLIDSITAVPPPKILWKQIAAKSNFSYATARNTLTYTITAFDI
jgi:alpha-tubulin suppressor-like RCC1 family protein